VRDAGWGRGKLPVNQGASMQEKSFVYFKLFSGAPPKPSEAGSVGRGGRNGAFFQGPLPQGFEKRAQFLPTKSGG